MISGKSTLVAHIGYPTESFKASFIYNPWFDKAGIDAVVVPSVVPVHQPARRVGDDAAQGNDGIAGRRMHDHGEDRRVLQRGASAP